MIPRSRPALLAALAALAAWSAPAQSPVPVAIRNATVVTVSGPTLNRGTVVMRGGLIEAVGDAVPVPPEAAVIEAEGLTVYPGLIDALSDWGLPAALTGGGGGGRGGAAPLAGPAAPGAPAPRPPSFKGPEDRPATTSWLRAADEIQPADQRLARARSAGFTSAAVFPMRGIVAGQGALVNLAGQKSAEMVVTPALGQYLSMSPSGNGFPSALFGTIAYIRQLYLDADYYALLRESPAVQGLQAVRPPYDRALEGILESRRLLLPAHRRVEIDRMLRFASELKRPAILYGMREAYRSIDLLSRNKTPVLVSLRWPERRRDPDPEEIETLKALEVRDQAPSAPAALKKAGLAFAFYSDTLDQPRELHQAVRKAIAAGLPREDAVRALTLAPAQIYGLADRLGSIERGKIANLVVTRGPLFDENTRIEMVFIDGKQYTPAPEPPAAGAPKPTQRSGGER
jgi:hypothetical protein